MVHPEIVKTKPESIDVQSDELEETSVSTKDSPAGSLNVSNGFSGLIFTDILQHEIKSKSIHDNLKKRYAEGKEARNC